MVSIIDRYLVIMLQHVLINKDHDHGDVLRVDKWYCQGLHNISQNNFNFTIK